jgi:hypothetical protein
LAVAAEFVLNASLRRAFKPEFLDMQEVRTLLEQARVEGVQLDSAGLAYSMQRKLNGLMGRLRKHPRNLGLLHKILLLVDLIQELPFAVNLWRVENLYYDMANNTYPELLAEGSVADDWVQEFLELGRKLRIRVEDVAARQLAHVG